MHEDDGEFRRRAGAARVVRAGAPVASIPRRRQRARDDPAFDAFGAGRRRACARPRRAWRRSSSRRRRARCALRAHPTRPRTRRGHFAGAPPTAAWPAADRRQRARADRRAAGRCRAATWTAISRAWLKPRSRWRLRRERQRHDALRALASRSTGERDAHGRGERRPGPFGERNPAAVFDALEQAVSRKGVGERPRPSRRTAAGARGRHRRPRRRAEGSAQTGHAAAIRGSDAAHAAHNSASPACARRTSSQRCGRARRSERARLDQPARRAAPAVKRFGAAHLTRPCPPSTLGADCSRRRRATARRCGMRARSKSRRSPQCHPPNARSPSARAGRRAAARPRSHRRGGPSRASCNSSRCRFPISCSGRRRCTARIMRPTRCSSRG